MSNNFREWWTRYIRQDKKNLYRIGALGALGVLLLGFGSFGMPAPSPPASKTHTATDPLVRQEHEIGNQVASMLEAVPGAGHVTVAMTLTRSIQAQYVEGNNGGSTGNQPVMVSTSNGQSVVPLDQIGPSVGGVVVVAKSAVNPTMRAELSQAVQTLLQIQAFQVLILPN